MADKDEALDAPLPAEEDAPATPPPRRSLGHRGADVRDTVAEMTAKAHEISLEAGSKMAGAMRDVINAAAGLAEFALGSARDLVQYMVRRGQMSQEEGERLLRDAEEAQTRRRPAAPPPAPAVDDASAKKPAAKKAAEPAAAHHDREHAEPAREPAPAAKKAPAPKIAAKAPTAKAPAKAPGAKAPATKAAPSKAPTAKGPATKSAAKKAAKKR